MTSANDDNNIKVGDESHMTVDANQNNNEDGEVAANEAGDEAHHSMTPANDDNKVGDESHMTVDADQNNNEDAEVDANEAGDEVNTSAIEDADESEMIEIMASMASANEIHVADDADNMTVDNNPISVNMDAVNMTMDPNMTVTDEENGVNMTVTSTNEEEDADGVHLTVASTNEDTNLTVASVNEDADGTNMTVAEDGINMDIDDIDIREDSSSQVVVGAAADTEMRPETEMRPSSIVLNHLLQRKATHTSHWTHLVRQPDTVRCCITDHQEAGELYRAVWRYADCGLSVMERRLSPITRVSIEVRLASHQLLASRMAENSFLHAILDMVLVDLRQLVSTHGLSQAALTGFILRPPRQARSATQQYWIHWPGLAVSNREFTVDWCNQNWQIALKQYCESITPRNTTSYVPMYGCAVTQDEPPMLVHWAVDRNGKIHDDWVEWLMHDADAMLLSDVFYIGHQRTWPDQKNLDACRVHRLLPLVTSINPMGTPCVPFTAPRAGSLLLGPHSELLHGRIQRILHHLGDHRRNRHATANMVGQHVYQTTSGADWALQLWMSWVLGNQTYTSQQAAELAFEWQTFAQGDPDVDAQAVLHEMIRQDNADSVYQQFLHDERIADHEGRGLPDDMLFSIIGSATHHDLARYIKHELRSTAVCTSMAGHGIWYTYNRKTHRWMFDPEGTDVLVQCLQILSDLVEQLRNRIGEFGGDSNTGPRNGGPRSPFPVLANFPLDGYSERDIQRAVLVHLDTIIGDVRHMQSVVRYLGKLVMNRTFPDQLDVRHEHLVPFANGVLDLDRLELRPGRPEDMLMRGPSYAWCDFASSDPESEEMERMLSQIFVDREVLSFFLEVGATWLRRRNRFKHFYIFTGQELLFADKQFLLPVTRTAGRVCCSVW